MSNDRPDRETRSIVRVEPLGAEFEARRDETIIEAAWRQGYHWPTACFAQATCTMCHMEVLAGAEHLSPVGDEEEEMLGQLPRKGRRATSVLRLACRARTTGDVTVRHDGVRRRR